MADELKLRDALLRAGLTPAEADAAVPRLLRAKADADARASARCVIDKSTVPTVYNPSDWEDFYDFGYC